MNALLWAKDGQGRSRPGAFGFTLIELLVVIAIIAIVAGLIAGLASGASKKKVNARAIALISELSMAIDGYKDQMGFYPPDNKNNPARPPLYYSLKGTRKNGTNFQPEEGDSLNEGQIQGAFGIPGFLNFVEGSAKPKDFYPHLRPDNVKQQGPVKFIVLPYKGPEGDFNPVHYNQSSPTNNPGSYDLWIDVVVAGKTNTIPNWRQ